MDRSTPLAFYAAPIPSDPHPRHIEAVVQRPDGAYVGRYSGMTAAQLSVQFHRQVTVEEKTTVLAKLDALQGTHPAYRVITLRV